MAGGFTITNLGDFGESDGFVRLSVTGDGRFAAGEGGVKGLFATGDRKVEFVDFGSHSLALVHSGLGYPAYYPVSPVEESAPVSAVMMDLDGTTVHSEEFWIEIIRRTTASVLGDGGFCLSEEDLPFVSGHSVSEHLNYCLEKYHAGASLEEARAVYFRHVHGEMRDILAGKETDGFRPNDGVKEFLLALKERGIKIGLVTSGLYEKAWPEILSAFREMELGDPVDFYDAIITAGYPLGPGAAGTLGELEAKPHPWLYAETAAVGLGAGEASRGSVIGVEDSGAGVCSIRLSGHYTVGISGGNILQSGTRGLCGMFCERFAEILDYIDRRARRTG
jgi:beta-phosphoglucomutase-like phosphatase (HAD superfamily)